MRLHSYGTALMAALLLSACSTAVKLDDTPVESRSLTAGARGGAAGSMAGGGTAAGVAGGQAGLQGGTAQSQVATVDLANAGSAAGADGASGANGRVVYFDFDSFAVRDEFRGLVEAHARALAANKARRLVVEGHTDERGGREYNLALGQKRAEAVVKSLALLGAGEGQLEAVSFGKERPATEGHDEDAWAKNRRAELKDR